VEDERNSFQNLSGLTSLTADLTGSVPPASLTSVPAASLTGTVQAGVLAGANGTGLINLNASQLLGIGNGNPIPPGNNINTIDIIKYMPLKGLVRPGPG
jgi:hypothetical protein